MPVEAPRKGPSADRDILTGAAPFRGRALQPGDRGPRTLLRHYDPRTTAWPGLAVGKRPGRTARYAAHAHAGDSRTPAFAVAVRHVSTSRHRFTFFSSLL